MHTLHAPKHSLRVYGPDRHSQQLALHLEFERIEGELDAAFVFAAAAEEQYCKGQKEFGGACQLDANGCHALAVERMSKAHLTDDQRQVLVAKLDHFGQSMRRLRSIACPTKNEAV